MPHSICVRACYIRFVISESNLLVSWRARPRGLVALMALYESNYVRLAELAGHPASLRGAATSIVPGDCELRLQVLERSRYTTDLSLTYLLPPTELSGQEALAVPNLLLRAYHDARLVEVLPGATSRERELLQSWTRNMMLNKWLEYCAERGHHFS
jgi:uncharacterized protein YqiB (DUF1249 family)